MSGREVLGCVAAVVSAFSGAADTLGAIKERKERKKRKKDREVEELVEIRLLHKSLTEGASQCRLCSEDRHRRYGLAFDMGDHIASSQLKDVVITLQTEVIQALQIARAVESAVLDLSRLHESSITSRKDAIRAMDDLCRRIMSGGSNYGQQSHELYGQRASSDSPRPQYIFPQMGRTSSDDYNTYQPGYMSGYPPANVYQGGQSPNQHPAYQRAQSTRSPDTMIYQGMPRQSHTPSHSWGGTSMVSPRQASVPEDDEDETPKDYNDLDRMSELSLRDSGLGSDVSSRHTAAVPSIGSIAGSDIPRQASLSERSTGSQQGHISRESSNSVRNQPGTTETRRKPVPEKNEDEDDMSPDSSDREDESQSSPSASRTASASHSAPTSGTSATIESADDMTRAMHAPEVVTKGYESMLSKQGARPSPHQKRPSHLAAVHPALRVPYNYIDSPASPEADHVWLPLPRPARHNNYHGFCKGAWQIRKSVQEGLSVQMIPNAEGVNIPHWTCKLCQFRSRALNQHALPDQIYFNTQSGVRYRWLFLAKSHVAAVGSFNKPENYAYGCIFCAAEGRTTATHEKLDKLMAHILSKHKTVMMTPETKEKTKCIVGGTPDRAEEWDVNLPETKPRFVAGGAVGEFVVSAVTGLSRYGASNAL